MSGAMMALINNVAVNAPFVPVPVTSGLQLYLDAASSTSYPGSGTTWYDLSSNHNDVVMQNSGNISFTSSGGSYFTLTSNGYFSKATTTGIPTGTSPYTFSVWVQWPSGSWPTSGGMIGVGSSTTSNLTNQFRTTNTNAYVNYWYGNDLTATSTISPTSLWVNVVAQWDGTTRKIWVNGTQFASAAASGLNVSSSLIQVGATNVGGSETLQGNIGQALIYDRALTPTEIQDNYISTRTRYGQGVVTSGLALYYDPSNSSSYSGSGTTINSLAPTNLPGSMSNITYTNPYFAYNGTSSTVSIADNALLEPGTGDFTIEAWVYYSTITGSTRTFMSKTDNGGTSSAWSYGLRTQTSGATYIEVGNGTTSVTSPTYTVTTGQWYQIVGVWTNVASNSIELYINGASQGSNSHSFASVKNSTNPLYLGSYNGGEFSQWLNGRMGIVRYYNAALTASQVLQNYNANRSVYGL